MGSINFRSDQFYPTVHEVTMASKRIVRVEIHDPLPVVGAYVQHGLTETGPYALWQQRNNPVLANQPDLCQIMGPNKTHWKFQERRPRRFFKYENAQSAASYGNIGTRNVIGVGYQNDLETKGFWNADGLSHGAGTVNGTVQLKHFLDLYLDGTIEAGTHTITFPENTLLKPYTFTFDDKLTRCCWLKTSHIGHRRTDKGKMAVGYVWSPQYALDGGGGAVACDSPTFNIIDSNQNVVYTGNIVLNLSASSADILAPTAMDQNNALGGKTGLTWFADYSLPELTVVSITNGTPGKLVFPAGTLIAENELLALGWMQGSTLGNTGKMVMCKNIVTTAGSTTVDVYNSIGTAALVVSGSYSPNYGPYGHNGKAWRVITQNMTRSHTYWMEFGDWTPGTNGTYYVQIPGLGVSYPISIDDNVWLDFAKHVIKGLYHKRGGCALDGRYGYTRGVAMRDGVNGVEIVKSYFPFPWTTEGGIKGAGGVRPESPGKCDSWLLSAGTERIDAGGEYYDAGDWDIYGFGHTWSTYLLCWLVDRVGVAALEGIDFGLPLSSDTNCHLGAGYDELDGLPNIIHNIVWPVAMYVRTQAANGAYCEGIQGSSQGQLFFEPSSEGCTRWYTYFPDHFSNYHLAGVIGMAARILINAGAPVLGALYLDSAKRGYAWAKDVDDHLVASQLNLTGVTGTFIYGETVTNARSGATGIVTIVGNPLRIKNATVQAQWVAGDVVSGGTSLASGTISAAGATINPIYDPTYHYRDSGMMRTATFTANITAGATAPANRTMTNVSSFTGINVGDQIKGPGLNTAAAVACVVESMNPGAGTILLRAWRDKIGQGGTILARSGDGIVSTSQTGQTYTACLAEAGYTEQSFTSDIFQLQQGLSNWLVLKRTMASGILSRTIELLEGAAAAAPYRALFEAKWTNAAGTDMWGRYEYMITPSASPTLKSTLLSGFTNQLNPFANTLPIYRTKSVAAGGVAKSFPAWMMDRFLTTLMGPSGNATSVFSAGPGAVEAAKYSPSSPNASPANIAAMKIAMQRGFGYCHGMNQEGMSYMTGFGHRPVRNLLSEDCYVLGPLGSPAGGIQFGPSSVSYGWTPAGGFNIWGGADLSQNSLKDVASNSVTAEALDERRHIIYPFHPHFPQWHHWDCQDIIAEAEDGIPNVDHHLLCGLWLHFNPDV